MNNKIIISKFLIFSFTCAYILPLFYYSDSLNILLKYYILILVGLLFMTLLFFKNPDIKNNINQNVIFSKTRRNLILFLILIIYVFIYFKSKDYFIGFFNRNTRESEFIQSNTYVILDLILKSLFAFLFFYDKKSIFLKTVILLFALFFDFAYLGGRRTSSFIFLIFIWNSINRINKKYFNLFLCILFLMAFMSFLFSGYRELIILGFYDPSFVDIINASIITNEFQLVSSYFVDYVKFTDDNGFAPFSIFSSILTIFIPRFLWINKPQTIDKVLGIFPNIFGEFYYYFGPFSIVIFIFIIFLLLRQISNHTIISSILFALIPDFFRTTFNQYILTIILYIFILYFIELILPVKNVET